jgi:hypothetical protein
LAASLMEGQGGVARSSGRLLKMDSKMRFSLSP